MSGRTRSSTRSSSNVHDEQRQNINRERSKTSTRGNQESSTSSKKRKASHQPQQRPPKRGLSRESSAAANASAESLKQSKSSNNQHIKTRSSSKNQEPPVDEDVITLYSDNECESHMDDSTKEKESMDLESSDIHNHNTKMQPNSPGRSSNSVLSSKPPRIAETSSKNISTDKIPTSRSSRSSNQCDSDISSGRIVDGKAKKAFSPSKEHSTKPHGKQRRAANKKSNPNTTNRVSEVARPGVNDKTNNREKLEKVGDKESDDGEAEEIDFEVTVDLEQSNRRSLHEASLADHPTPTPESHAVSTGGKASSGTGKGSQTASPEDVISLEEESNTEHSSQDTLPPEFSKSDDHAKAVMDGAQHLAHDVSKKTSDKFSQDGSSKYFKDPKSGSEISRSLHDQQGGHLKGSAQVDLPRSKSRKRNHNADSTIREELSSRDEETSSPTGPSLETKGKDALEQDLERDPSDHDDDTKIAGKPNSQELHLPATPLPRSSKNQNGSENITDSSKVKIVSNVKGLQYSEDVECPVKPKNSHNKNTGSETRSVHTISIGKTRGGGEPVDPTDEEDSAEPCSINLYVAIKIKYYGICRSHEMGSHSETWSNGGMEIIGIFRNEAEAKKCCDKMTEDLHIDNEGWDKDAVRWEFLVMPSKMKDLGT